MLLRRLRFHKMDRNLLNTSYHNLAEIPNCFGDGFFLHYPQDFIFILRCKMIYIAQSSIAFIATEIQKVSSDIAHIRSHKSRYIEADSNFRRKKARMLNSKGVKLSLCQNLSTHKIKEKTESWYFVSLFPFVSYIFFTHFKDFTKDSVFII